MRLRFLFILVIRINLDIIYIQRSNIEIIVLIVYRFGLKMLSIIFIYCFIIFLIQQRWGIINYIKCMIMFILIDWVFNFSCMSILNCFVSICCCINNLIFRFYGIKYFKSNNRCIFLSNFYCIDKYIIIFKFLLYQSDIILVM